MSLTKKDIAQILEIVKDANDYHIEAMLDGVGDLRLDGKEDALKEIETKLEEMRKQRKP